MLSNLRYVVVDEGHSYRGVFGCHTALVLRRLRRLCSRTYASSPTFVMCTATVANPGEHARRLLGVAAVRVVDRDGSPHGPKDFVLWNPQLVFSQAVSPYITHVVSHVVSPSQSVGTISQSFGQPNTVPRGNRCGGTYFTGWIAGSRQARQLT